MKKRFGLKIFLFEIAYLLLSTLAITLLAYGNVINDLWIRNLSLVISLINVFLLSFFISMKVGHHGLWLGFGIGVLYLLFAFIVRLLSETAFDTRFFVKMAILLVGSILGGILGVNSHKTAK